jgi:hypothetical protein
MNINNDNDTTEIIIEQFSHILAHQLKLNDSNRFNYIYDQIPKEINLNKVSLLKFIIIS